MGPTRAPFDVPSFGGMFPADRCIRATVVRALEVYATHGRGAAIAWIRADDAAVGGGWAELAESALLALSAGIRDGRDEVQQIARRPRMKAKTILITNTVDAARAALDIAKAECKGTSARLATGRGTLSRARVAHERDPSELTRTVFLDVLFPLEAECIEAEIAAHEADFAKRRAAHELAAALDADAVAHGDDAAICIASLPADLHALAVRTQTGDVATVDRAVEARIAQHKAALSALSARRRSVGDPEPLRIDPGVAWRALLEVARATAADVPITPAALLRAAFGYTPPVEPGMTVEDALATVLEPISPRPSPGKIERLRDDRARLNRHAFEIHEARELEAAERAKEAKLIKREREHEAARDSKRAAERAKEQAKTQDVARDRAARMDAFLRAEQEKRASLASPER
jgi:hypothetical protein